MKETSVLIVDDAPAAKRSLRRILAGLPGFRLAGEASDGREALSKALEIRPDVVITDIRMPCLDGLALAAELRRRGSEARVVIVSGYADFEYARTAMRLGVREFLLKPIVPGEVFRVLHRIAQEAGPPPPPGPRLPPCVQAGLDYMERHFMRPDISLREVAEAGGCSPAHFSRLFKKATGGGYAERLKRLRLETAVRLLENPRNHLYEVARYCGYSSYSHFEHVFREAYGRTPKSCRGGTAT